MIPEQLFEPEPHDSSAVSEALHAARAALGRGEPREALRLARQAAEAAESDGDDTRALGLARAAADLANELGGSVAPPPAPPPAPSSYSPPPASYSPPPASQAAPPASQSSAPASHAPASHSPAPASHSPPPESQAPPPESRSPQPPGSPSVAAPSSPAPKSTQSLEAELDALLASGRAVRVLVKRSARDEELYVVRRPVNGKPAFDAREALILLLEPDPDFFGSK